MPKYDVWFTIRGSKESVKATVSAKDKDEAKHKVKQEWYGNNPDIKYVKGHKVQ